MEIEARVKVDNLENLRAKLKTLGAECSAAEAQNDIIYKEKSKACETQKAGSYILRIRETGTKSFLTFKALTERKGVWKEYEVEIDDAQRMQQILHTLGFVNVLEMHKTRQHARLDKINICLDKIKELGTYLECEIIGEHPEQAKQELKTLLQKLGYDKKEIIHDGYLALLFKSKGIRFEGTA